MASLSNFTWSQGDDLTIDLIYKEGATADTASAVDLTTGYSVRMDIVSHVDKVRLYTFNSDDIADVDPIATGDQPDSVIEGTLSAGLDGTPNISITVPRSLTLPGGPLFSRLSEGTFNYDVFLRNTSTNKQAKILKGTIAVEESYTLWE